MSLDVLKGAVDQSVEVRVLDSTDGTPEAAFAFDTGGIALWYRREGGDKVAITPANLAALTTAHTDGGVKYISDGYVRIDVPDAAFATGATSVVIGGSATGMVIVAARVNLVAFNPQDAIRLGLTALPNAAADAAGGLPISDAGGLDLDAKLANTNEVTAARMGALTDWIDGGRLDLILDARASQASVDAVDNFIDTEIGDLTTNLAALITTVGAAGAGLTEAGGTGDHLTALATAAALATVDGIVDDIKSNTNYPDGYVYLSSFFGAAGTTLGTNGTWRNPVSTIADALTLANSIGGIKFMPNSAVTASSGTLADRVIDIHGGALTVASSVSLGGTLIYSTGRRGNLYGTALAQVTTSNTFLENLYVSGVIATAATLEMRHCGLSGNVTDSNAGPNASFRPLLIDCYNFKGDGSAVTFALAGGGHWHLLGWYGDLEITGMAAGQVFYANGWGKLTIAASCTGGTVKHTSHIEIVDNASGAVTTELISEPSPLSTAGNLAVADAILDRSASGHTTNSTLGAIINDWEDAGRLDAILDARASQASVDTIDDLLDTEVAAILAAVDTEIGAIQTTLAGLFTTALTESYRADGATGTVAQLLYEINQTLGERSISGTAVTVKKVDGSTTAFTQTLNDASTPTSITHAA